MLSRRLILVRRSSFFPFCKDRPRLAEMLRQPHGLTRSRSAGDCVARGVGELHCLTAGGCESPKSRSQGVSPKLALRVGLRVGQIFSCLVQTLC